MSESRRGWLPYVALAAIALIWGGSFLFIKVAVQDMSPMVLVLIRSASGSLALAVLMIALRSGLFPNLRRRVLPFAVMAITASVIPWVAIAWGEERISSGLASILNATTPLWAAILVYWVIPTERPSRINYAGVLLGLAGVVILVLPDIISGGIRGDLVGAAAVLLASMSYAVSALYQRRKLRGVNVFEANLGQLAFTALFLLPVAVPSLPAAHFEVKSIAAVLALGIGGSGIAGVLYYYVLNSLGPVRGSGVTLLVPVTAVFWGATLLGEVVTVPIIAGMIVILAGIVLTNVGRGKARASTDKAAA
ncbi:MAG TPA: DMT family transporter [Candidatus Dormibacteraeota bacterium]|nr:DMT family transporter [Candidatus Dormibacteraeota bacterium]